MGSLAPIVGFALVPCSLRSQWAGTAGAGELCASGSVAENCFSEPAMLRHVQFAILLQFAEHDKADLAGTAAVVPGADRRDFRLALENPLDEGSLESPTRQELSLEA